MVVPQCRTVDEVHAVLDGCFLPPRGSRGFSPRTRAAARARAGIGPSTHAEIVDLINQSTSVVIQVETPELLADVDAIAGDERITALLLGAHDLAVASGEADGDVTESASARLAAATAERPLAWGRVVSPGEVERATATGARFLLHGSEAALIARAIEGIGEVIGHG